MQQRQSQALNLTDDERSNLQYSRTEVHIARDRGSISPDRLPGIQRFVNDPAQVLASTILHEFFHGVAPWIYWNFWDVQIEDASTPYPNGQEEQDARSRQNSLHNILLNE